MLVATGLMLVWFGCCWKFSSQGCLWPLMFFGFAGGVCVDSLTCVVAFVVWLTKLFEAGCWNFCWLLPVCYVLFCCYYMQFCLLLFLQLLLPLFAGVVVVVAIRSLIYCASWSRLELYIVVIVCGLVPAAGLVCWSWCGLMTPLHWLCVATLCSLVR